MEMGKFAGTSQSLSMLQISIFLTLRFQDVLVGAPLYFTTASIPEAGAVYIYENQVNVCRQLYVCMYSRSCIEHSIHVSFLHAV